MKISRASSNHADGILNILEPFIKSGVILPRDKSDILNSIDSFFIAEFNDRVIGCTAVKNYGDGLFEIRSLVVEKGHNNKGIGKKLITFAVQDIIDNRKPNRIFALTLRPEVFLKAGFKEVLKSNFPEKIWEDCWKCSKYHNCDEIALIYNFEQNRN